MRKHLAHIAALALVIAIFAVPQPAHAGFWDTFTDIFAGIFNPIALAILKLTALITHLGGVTLNFAINYTIVDMKEHLTGLSGIDTAWSLVRDVGNMLFIFVLLYTAIMTIIGDGSSYRRVIVNMIIAAALINFSLFFTKIVIDAGNLLALTFYDAIAPGAAADSVSIGLSNSLMEPLKLQNLYKVATSGFAGGKELFVVMIMGSIFQLIAGFVFFAVALMFVVRYIVLLFVLVLSPLYFISMILPQLGSYKKQWQEALLNQTFFPVIYFILTWILIVLMRSPGFLPGGVNWSAALQGEVNAAGALVIPTTALGTIFNFILIIGLLIGTLVLSKGLANKSSFGLNKWMMEKAGGATLGLSGKFARSTAGRLGQVVADSETLKKAAPTSRLARLALASGQKTAGASFDIRATGLGKTLGAGKAQSGGFAKDMKDRIEKEKKTADSFKPTDLVVAQAERDLEIAKNAKTDDPAYRSEWNKEQQRAEDNLKRTRAALESARKRNAPAEEIAELQDEATTAEVRRDRLQTIEGYKEVREGEAQARVDELKGVNEDEAKKRYRKVLKDQGLNEQQINDKVRSEDGKKEIKRLQRQSASNERKEAYASHVEKAGIGGKYFGLDLGFRSGRLGWIGPVKKEDLGASLAIRKSIKDKKPEDTIAEAAAKIAKQQAEKEKEEETPAAPATPPASGGSTPPANP